MARVRKRDSREDVDGNAVERPPSELPLLSLPSSHPCEGCAECCRYVALEIDNPTTPKDYDHIFWYLTHRDVAVYIDWEADWYVEFQTRCEHLTDFGTCGIYRERPHICSDFSWDTCERTTREPAARYRFEKAEDFFAWLEKRRPRSHARYLAFRRELLAGRVAGSANGRSRRRRTRATRRAEART